MTRRDYLPNFPKLGQIPLAEYIMFYRKRYDSGSIDLHRYCFILRDIADYYDPETDAELNGQRRRGTEL